MDSNFLYNYNLGLIPAALKSEALYDDSDSSYLEKLMNGMDEIDKQNVIDHMGEFSCREELARFVENKQLPRITR